MDGPFEVVRIEIAKLECKPGDTVLIRVPLSWDFGMMAAMQREMARSEFLPDGVRFGIVGQDISFEVLSAPARLPN
jgi:hypothetical protein